MRRLTVVPVVLLLVASALTSSCAVAARPADGAPAPNQTAEKIPTPSSTAPTTKALGSSWRWDDGLQVATSAPVKWTPSDTSAGHTTGNQAIRFSVTVTNGSTKVFDPALVGVTLTYGADGQQAEAVFDSAKKVNGPNFTQKLLPGKRATVTAAFDVPPAGLKDMQVQVSLGTFEHDSVIFTGSVK